MSAAEDPKGTRSLASAGSLLLLAFVVTKVLGYVAKVVIAHRFGTGAEYDAYVLSFTIPDFFLFLVLGGAVSSAFIPVTTSRLARGDQEGALGVVNGVMSAALLVLFGGVILLELLAPQVVALLAGGLPSSSRPLALTLTRILLLQPLFLGLGGFSLGVMNAYRRYGRLALAPLAYDLAIIFGALVLTRLRLHGHSLGIPGLAAGVVLGGLVHFLVQVPALLKLGWRPLSMRHLRDPGVVRVARLTVPIALGLVAAQANIAIDRRLASTLVAGSISSLDYANEIAQIPNLTFTTALTLVMFPLFAHDAALGALDELRHRAALAVRLNFFILLPSAVAFVVLGREIVGLLLQRGTFDAHSTDLVYGPLALFSVGIAAQASIFLVVRVYYSLQRVITPMLVAFAAVVFNLAATALLLRPLGAAGLALATSLSSILNLGLLVALLRPHIGGFEGGKALRMLLLAAVGCVALAVVSLATYRLVAGSGPLRLDPRHYAALAFALGAGGAAFLLVERLLGAPEAGIALAVVTRRRPDAVTA